MSSGRDYMMDRWAEEYQQEQKFKEKQMAFEFDYDELREREFQKHRDQVREEMEYRRWTENKECND